MNTKILAALLFLSLFPLQAFSQAKVKSMTETMDFIPREDQRKDYNNQLLALVKVQVVDEITDVEGNVMPPIVNKGVEKWVYMAKGSRNMKIHFKNNLPLRIMFKDFDIDGLKSNRVYEVVIEVPNAPAQEAQEAGTNVNGNYLQMQVTPASATVNIWSEDNEYQKKAYRPQDDGRLRVYLPYGRYYYSVEAVDYDTLEGSVFVNDEDKWENIVLKANPTRPSGADASNRQNQPVATETVAAEKAEKPKKVKEPKQPKVKTPVAVNEKDSKAVVFGVIAGMNMASTKFDKKYDGSVSSQTGFHFGATAELRLADNMYINTGLIYSGKGYKYESNRSKVKETGTAQYIDIPVLFAPRFDLGSSLKLEVNAGPYAAFCIGGKVKDEWTDNSNQEPAYDESFSSAYSGFDYGLQAGAAAIISNSFRIGASYQMGMGSSYQNNNIMFSLGYRF